MCALPNPANVLTKKRGMCVRECWSIIIAVIALFTGYAFKYYMGMAM